MDRKYKSLDLLHEKLIRSFTGGQFQIMIGQGEIWRGKIMSWGILDRKKKRVLEIWFEWYVRVHATFDISGTRRMVGREFSSPCPKRGLTLRLKKFYHPHNHFFPKGDPRRIKGLTETNEEFRFFKFDDPTNLYIDAYGELVSDIPVNPERFKRGIPEPLGPP